jgi:hypothetical protein
LVKFNLLAKFKQPLALLCCVFLTIFNVPTGHAMEADQALKLVEAFGKSVRDNAYVGRMQVDPRGGWVTRARGGTFRYDPVKKKLMFSSFIASGLVALAEVPQYWDDLVRHGKRMPKVMGDGYFELIKAGPFLDHNDFPLLMLTKDFSDGGIKPEQFIIEAQWLLYGGVFWGGGPKPYGFIGVQTQPEEVLIKVAEKIQKERPPRPW